MSLFSVKLQWDRGGYILILTSDTTVGDLKKQIHQLTKIDVDRINLVTVNPLKRLNISRDSRKVNSIGLSGNDKIVVIEGPPDDPIFTNNETLANYLKLHEEQRIHDALTEERDNPSSSGNVPIPYAPSSPSGTAPSRSAGGNSPFNGTLLRQRVPADNSCLFTSMRFVINGGLDNESSESMRKLVAQELAADPNQYNDAVLGQTNAAYREWIQRLETWGGAIELAILSNYYGIEIDVVDVQNSIINRFGEDRNYSLRVFLHFDGVHYDPLYMERAQGRPATMFPVDEMSVYQQAEMVAKGKIIAHISSLEDTLKPCPECGSKSFDHVHATDP